MRTFEFSVFIDRPPQEVFDFVTNPDNDHLWQETLVSSEWVTPEPAGAGSIKKVVIRFLGRNMEGTVEYISWDPPDSYRFKSDDGPFSLEATTKFEPKEGGTQLTLEAQLEGGGLLKLVMGLVTGQAKKQDTKNFNALKEILEAG
jgi:uncharacterized protein YndB with AHSA1/START domain